jgi:hypothetical protein
MTYKENLILLALYQICNEIMNKYTKSKYVYTVVCLTQVNIHSCATNKPILKIVEVGDGTEYLICSVRGVMMSLFISDINDMDGLNEFEITFDNIVSNDIISFE